nr:MAG TPA: hypothetical protein [Caudoviricetes sp.]
MHRQRDCGEHRHQPRHLVYMEEKISNFSRYLKKGKRCCGQASGKKSIATGIRIQLRGDKRKVRRRSNDGAKSNEKTRCAGYNSADILVKEQEARTMA